MRTLPAFYILDQNRNEDLLKIIKNSNQHRMKKARHQTQIPWRPWSGRALNVAMATPMGTRGEPWPPMYRLAVLVRLSADR